MPAPVIATQNLVKSYAARNSKDFVAVDGISFEVAPGESFGLLGPNGAGKSTTMRMIGAVSTRTSGDLKTDAVDGDEILRVFDRITLEKILGGNDRRWHSSNLDRPAPMGMVRIRGG